MLRRVFQRAYFRVKRWFHQRFDLVLEHIALQQQLRVLQRSRRPPRFTDGDRLFWVVLSHTWDGWREALVIAQPQTVQSWRRQPWRYWLQRRDRRPPGRPPIDADIQALIRHMRRANVFWGAPRIHGELLKLGIQVAESTVAKYMGCRNGKPSPTWRAFLRNEAHALSLQAEFHLPESLQNAVRQIARLLRCLVLPAQTRGTGSTDLMRFSAVAHPGKRPLQVDITLLSRSPIRPLGPDPPLPIRFGALVLDPVGEHVRRVAAVVRAPGTATAPPGRASITDQYARELYRAGANTLQ